MKSTIHVTKLNDAIDIASRFVAKNATLPILQNIYIKASVDTMIIRATDMEKYVEIEIPCKVQDEGAITINAKTFNEIIKSIEEDQMQINADLNTQIVNITTAKDTFAINGIAANEYVALPEIPQEKNITLDTLTFAKGIEKVEYAVTDKNFSPVLTGVLLRTKESDKDKLTFVGTDSFRLAEYKVHTNTQGQEFSVIIPKASISDIHKIAQYAIANESEQIQLHFSDNLISFSCTVQDTKILATSLLIQGNFPDYERPEIMPDTFNHSILVDKNACDKAIRKISILTKDINNYIQIQTQDNSIQLSSGKTDKGAGNTSITAIVEWEETNFGINGRYISDFVKNTEGNEITFNIVDNNKPIVLTDKNDSAYKYVVRPLINN
jgi:DNA polymerase III subunit beta